MIIIHRKGERRDRQNFFAQLAADKHKAKKQRDIMAEEFANYAPADGWAAEASDLEVSSRPLKA